jgi:hypothetical protein
LAIWRTRLFETEAAEARSRRLAAMRLQEIESNPLDAEDIAMFEMFERERWSFEQRRVYILRKTPDAIKALGPHRRQVTFDDPYIYPGLNVLRNHLGIIRPRGIQSPHAVRSSKTARRRAAPV